jgi:hypothetical protein
MHLALFTTFAASRKEPLATVLERVHAAILAADFGEPQVQFVMADSPIAGGVSSVARVIKRFPVLERFAQTVAPSPGAPGAVAHERRILSNRPSSGAAGEPVDFSILLEIARGVPKSFPFHNLTMHFSVPAFSAGTSMPPTPDGRAPGITVIDSWWVNGRNRSVSALTLVEADPAARKLPAVPESITAVLAACGKVKKTVQMPVVVVPTAQGPSIDTVAPEKAAAIRAVVQDYRTRMSEILEGANLPHDLPPNQEALATGVTSGPKKPSLVRAFTPMGYDCRSESAGTFTMRRRTPGNLTAELHLDVGTWSNLIMAIFRLKGLIEGVGFKATLFLPVARRAAMGGQYPIGGPERWQQIVDNLTALVAELDRTFVPAIEEIAGPSPDWYKPESGSTG